MHAGECLGGYMCDERQLWPLSVRRPSHTRPLQYPHVLLAE